MVNKREGQGMNAEPFVLRLFEMNDKERRLLATMIELGGSVTLNDMGVHAFGPLSPAATRANGPVQANSWARNSKRALVRGGYLRQTCKKPSTYEATIAPIGKYASMKTIDDVVNEEEDFID